MSPAAMRFLSKESTWTELTLPETRYAYCSCLAVILLVSELNLVSKIKSVASRLGPTDARKRRRISIQKQ